MINNSRIRLLFVRSLIFSFLLAGCAGQQEKKDSLSLQWEKGKAVAIIIPQQLLANASKDSIEQFLQVRLAAGSEQPAILGEYSIAADIVNFRPLIPFTPGLKYVVVFKNKIIGEMDIPATDPKDAPTVIAVYPTPDTLPENLLKMYIRFSKPMQEGQSLQHVTLIKNGRDTVTAVFLELQRELWNNDHTTLTLWLDPGRIKRDLQPNINMGPPLQQSEQYELIIQKDWRDTYGASLAKPYQKKFVVGVRDSISPDPELWTIYSPAAGTIQPLTISFNEPLDYVLLNNTLRFVDSSGNMIGGIIQTNDAATSLTFTPTDYWNRGNYTLECEARLEDLAGNNLNRLFDTDLAQQKNKDRQNVFKRPFQIR